MPITLNQLNAAPHEQALAMLDGLYEHSPWIAEKALAQRPFRSLAHLKRAMVWALEQASTDAQLALIRAHPELAGKAMVSKTLTAESTHEQDKAGLTSCTQEEFDHIHSLNQAYNQKFGFPFILAVRGPRGQGLSKQAIIATFERRLHGHPEVEMAECLRNIHRIAEIRLDDKFGQVPTWGNRVWDWHEALAQFSDPVYKEAGQLTVTYLTEAHQACAQMIRNRMQDAGFDEVDIDAVGNVTGVYRAAPEHAPQAKTLLTGSHYDTVRNGGKYDGRLGIFVPIACVQALAEQRMRLPYHLEVVAFAEEEGQRYSATFLGSSALTGRFNTAWLNQQDKDGITMLQAMQQAGLDPEQIGPIARKADDYLGFIEVHIEQGPVLNELSLPLGVVTSINGSLRYQGVMRGTACHAGTTPMSRRSDAACGVAELMLYLESRAAQDGDSVATVGQLVVPSGSVNVVPGECHFSLDMRAPTDAQRDALAQDVKAEVARIAHKRRLSYTLTETLSAPAAPSSPALQKQWEAAVQAQGLEPHLMPSGAGHDAMMLHNIMPQAMLFVRGENAGISHNPLESTTNNDMELAVHTFRYFLDHFTPV